MTLARTFALLAAVAASAPAVAKNDPHILRFQFAHVTSSGDGAHASFAYTLKNGQPVVFYGRPCWRMQVDGWHNTVDGIVDELEGSNLLRREGITRSDLMMGAIVAVKQAIDRCPSF